MAEDESDQESERLGEELEGIAIEDLQGIEHCGLRSREYCRRFCEVVEDYTARWHVPLPQLQVLQTALCCFTSASTSFPAECEHVQYVLSRLALSLFELLLFFGKDEFYEAPLKDLLGSVQECHDHLVRYDNTDLRMVTHVIKDGGPWEHPVLQAILKGKSEPQDTVNKYLMSENELFFELRVRYLIACERIPEAVALITTCLSHPEVSKNLYYHQAYFTCLHMTRLTDQLFHEHILRIDCGDAVQIICNTEEEGKTALALQISEAFLIMQLQAGKMYCLWDLIFVWSKLQLKVNPSKEVFVEQCYQMLRIARNVKAIFPFMKRITDEVGEVGVQLAVELCGCALQLDLQDDTETKSLIYKTIAYLLPTDLEICRICVLSVFFLERTMESYCAVERLYKCSDEDYNEFTSHVENRVRFELLPILKKGLLFDPEFWNFSMIQKNCAILLGGSASIPLSKSNTLDNADQLNLYSAAPSMDLKNGLIEHNVSRKTNSRIHVNRKRNHSVLRPYKIDHSVPRHQCTLCKKEFLGGHIFRHARVHQKMGCFSCVLCARRFRNGVNMLKHLKNHIKKIQRRPMTNHAAPNESPLETNKAISLVTSYLSLENRNSDSSASDLLTNVVNQESCPEPSIPAENHKIDCSNENLIHPTHLNHSGDVVALSGKSHVDGSSSKSLPECIKVNGSLGPFSGDQVKNHQENYSCPAQGCVRIFKKVRSLNKHARIAHPNDKKVQLHIMKWNKGKCRFCHRKFADPNHFFDHLKQHVYPNVHFCQHINCNERFKLTAQLTEHMNSHKSFKAQCRFINCSELFEELSKLYEHEALHYKQGDIELPGNNAPVDDNLVDKVQDSALARKISPGLCNEKNALKKKEMLELPVPVWKTRLDAAEPKTYTPVERRLNSDTQNRGEISQECSDVPVITDLQDSVQEMHSKSITEERLPNGHVQEQTVMQAACLESVLNTAQTGTKDHSTSSTAPDFSLENSATEHTISTSKRNPVASASYGATTPRPFIRPLPPSYLDERYISMPKRRKADETCTPKTDMVSENPVEKFKCVKCLTNFCSSEALEEHLAQKKCQSYFGFDSDDESAW
ncbi:zinc finger protein 654 [Rhinophrynus dorsalis]